MSSFSSGLMAPVFYFLSVCVVFALISTVPVSIPSSLPHITWWPSTSLSPRATERDTESVCVRSHLSTTFSFDCDLDLDASAAKDAARRSWPMSSSRPLGPRPAQFSSGTSSNPRKLWETSVGSIKNVLPDRLNGALVSESSDCDLLGTRPTPAIWLCRSRPRPGPGLPSLDVNRPRG
jgi:hypothetical protein